MSHAFDVFSNKFLSNSRSQQFSQTFLVEISNGATTLENRLRILKKVKRIQLNIAIKQ